nr:iron-containing alcohol dehydrogenase [Candidatus Njordarchaeum guaymaensis]
MSHNGVLIVTNLTGKGVAGKAYRRARFRFDEVKDELFVTRTERGYIEGLAKKYSGFDPVVGIGGGVAVDVAKFIGARNKARVIAFPTIISTDCIFTSSTAVREEGTVKYIPSKKPDELIIDYDLLLEAPYDLNVCGWGDVLSIHTALSDWRLSADTTGEKFDEEVACEAREIISNVCRVDTREGLETLVECLRSEVDLCDRWGNARPEEGSEHLFVYLLENYLDKPHPHGGLVALGIYEMSKLQGNEVKKICRIMDEIELPYQAEDVGISPVIVRKVISELPAYVKKHKFFYSVINRL